MSGPRDELRELGERFNEMLARLAAAIGRERRIMASGSTPVRTVTSCRSGTVTLEVSNCGPVVPLDITTRDVGGLIVRVCLPAG